MLEEEKKMGSLSSLIAASTRWYFNQKIFGLLNSMHLGVDIAKHLSLNTHKQLKILKGKSNLVRLMPLLRKNSAKDSEFKASQPSKSLTME